MCIIMREVAKPMMPDQYVQVHVVEAWAYHLNHAS